MKIQRSYRCGLCWAAVVGMCLPTSVVQGNEAHSTADGGQVQVTMIHDVALAPGGMLVGQVLDQSMHPVTGTIVEIQQHGQTMAATKTDDMGRFAVTGLRGGIHQVVTEESVENCRLWTPGTAPPHATTSLRYVPGQHEIVRGQWGSPHANSFAHKAKGWATNPWVVGGVIATAIAVPIILHNTSKDRPPAS